MSVGRRGLLAGCAFLPGRTRPYCGGEDLTLDAEGRWTGFPKEAHLSGWHTLDWPERVSGDPYPMWWDAGRGLWLYAPDMDHMQYSPGDVRTDRVYLGPRGGGPE